MTEVSTAPSGQSPSTGLGVLQRGVPAGDHRGSWVPTWALVTTKHHELRKRTGLMVAVVLLTVGFPVVILGIRLLFHAFDPSSYGPAGSPGVFAGLVNPMAEFGFIIAATVGTSAATTDLSEGMFRHLVITGRSRLALYFARLPAGLAIVLPLVAVAFTLVCLVTAYAGTPQPTTINDNGITAPVGLNEHQFEAFLLAHPQQVRDALTNNGVGKFQGSVDALVRHNISSAYANYLATAPIDLNPPINEMVKIGLWLELEITIGLVVGVGLGSLLGQRTISTILMIVLEIIITPILANNVIPYFINGQRLIVGVAMDQLRPAGLEDLLNGRGGGRVLFGGHGALGIPPMPTWAMIAVIAGWLVGWTAIGAWRMATRDA